MTSLENIRYYYNALEFGSTTHTVLRHCLTHLPELPDMTIYQLAEACYTSPSTISRLAKSLGYKGFSAFQLSIQDCVKRHHFHNRLVAPQALEARLTQGLLNNAGNDMELFLSNIEDLVQQAKKLVKSGTLATIAEMMHNASHVVIFPYGYFFCELFLQSDLFLTKIPCDVVNGDTRQLKVAKSFSENTFAIFLSPECIESSMNTESVVRTIKKKGGKICMVSASFRTPSLHLADVSVCFEGSRHAVDSFFMEMFIGLLTIQYRQTYLDSKTATKAEDDLP